MDKTEHEYTMGTSSSATEEQEGYSLLESIKNAVADTLLEISETVDKVSDKVGEPTLSGQGRRLARSLEDSARYVREFDYDKAEEQARRYVQENPGRSLLVAGAVGMVIGAICKRR